MHGEQRKSERIDNGVREDRSGKKVCASDMADRMEPTVRGREADTTDWEATAVRVEGMDMLEMEDEVEQGQQG